MDSIIYFMNTPYYWILLGIVFLLEIYLNSKVNIIVGKAGEYYAKEELKKLPKDRYTVINDLMIEVGDRTHQIDHVVISDYGIFVIETKQYNGYISGSKYDKKWVRKGKKNDVYYTNPIRQNYGHIKAICKLLKLDESTVYNVVYIPSTAKLHIKHDGEVVLADQLCKKILSYRDLKLHNKDEIVTMLKENNIVSRKRRRMHNKYLKNSVEKLDDMKCPRCGSDLKQRTGKFGMFYGCSNFPRCKYTVKIR